MKQLGPDRGLLFGSLCAMAATGLLALLPPMVLRWLIDRALPTRQVAPIIGAALLIFLSSEGRIGFAVLGNFLALTAAQRLALRIRLALLLQVDRLSPRYFETSQPGHVMYPFSEPVDEICLWGSDLFPNLVRTTLAIVLVLGTMFFLSPSSTAMILPLIPIFLVLRHYFGLRLTSASDELQLKTAEWIGFLEEHLSSILPVQLLAAERRRERIGFRALAHITRSYQLVLDASSEFTIFTSLAVALCMAIAIAFGGCGVIRGTMSLGSVVAFYTFTLQLFDPLNALADLYARTNRAYSSIRQIQSIFLLQPSIAEPRSPVRFPTASWDITCNRLQFSYDEERITLELAWLQISSGEKIAISGENGSGKSTFLRLLVRAYDPKNGTICIGAQDIRGLALADLRRNVCYLPRDPVLFSGTVGFNLRYVCQNASLERLRNVIELVGLHDASPDFERYLHRSIGTGGCQLSGGQRQRLAIARALLQSPRVLLLDEATSCLDPEAETTVLRNLQRSLPETTLIVVSHRPSTASHFSRLVVFSRGRILADDGPGGLSAR